MITNLTLIQTFHQVAKEGTYTAAAGKLGLTYQTVANHIRRLELMLGEKLIVVEKGKKNVALTQYGQTVFTLLDPELNLMLSRLSLLIETSRPIIRIGLPQSVFFYLFPAVLADLMSSGEKIEVQALERDTLLREMINEGALDVAISETHFGDARVPQRLLGNYSLRLIAPLAWNISLEPEKIREELEGRPFVTFEPGQTLRSLSIDFLRDSGLSPVVAVSTSGSSSVKRCVEAGLGYSIIPDWCVGCDEPLITSYLLQKCPKVPLYFGHTDFLANSPLVTKLFTECRRQFSSRMSTSS